MKLTLCGSAKFEDLYHEWNEKLTMAGHVVYSLAVFPSRKNGEQVWYTDEEKEKLDLAHLAKIENSEAIVVINKDGYVGYSTRREMRWARLLEKDIYFIESPNDDNFIDTFDANVHLL